MVALAIDDSDLTDTAPGAKTHGGGCSASFAAHVGAAPSANHRSQRGLAACACDVTETCLETGLYYARSRYFDSRTGVFLSRNPWAPNMMRIAPPPYWPNNVRGDGVGSYLQGRFNLYQFAFGSPPNYTEPFSEADPPKTIYIPPPPPPPYSPSGQYIGPAPPGSISQGTSYVPVSWSNPWMLKPVDKGSAEERFALAGYEGHAWAFEQALGAIAAERLLMRLALARGAGAAASECPTAGIDVAAMRQAYEQEVRDLAALGDAARGAGLDAEATARLLNAARRDLGVEYKALTPSDLLEQIYARNLAKYGDKLGPTVDWLRANGKTWDQIIESATRPGGKDLNLK